MKALKIMMSLFIFAAPAAVYSQSKTSGESVQTYQKRTYRKTTRITKKDSMKIKENGPILNDNGTTSTTGTIDGRSSTGRPGSDTLVNYTVKRKRTTVKTVGEAPESGSQNKKKP
jgi:hypothetical protein